MEGSREGEWPLVTVAILAYNRREELDITLRKLAEELDYPADRLEKIVVDNASTDGTGEMLAERHPGVQVITSEQNVGIPGWNPAFAAGRGDWFLALDDDCYVTGSALKDAVRRAREESADLVSFAVISAVDEGFRFDRDYQLGLLGFWGCAVLISRRTVDALGGYDPNIFLWANEPEFTLRVLNLGHRHLFLPEVVAVHMKAPHDGSAQSAFIRQTNSRHMAYIAAKHLRAPDLALAATRMARRTAVGALRSGGIKAELAALASGIRMGLRNRTPARPAVSRLYRDNFIEFVSPRLVARLPEMWTLRRDPLSARRRFEERQRDFWRARPALYPGESRSLKV